VYRVADEPILLAGDVLAYEHATRDERAGVDPGANRPVFRDHDDVRRNGLHELHLSRRFYVRSIEVTSHDHYAGTLAFVAGLRSHTGGRKPLRH
jgi:hypothetical protein